MENRALREEMAGVLLPTEESFQRHCKESQRDPNVQRYEPVSRLMRREGFRQTMANFLRTNGRGPYETQQIAEIQQAAIEATKPTNDAPRMQYEESQNIQANGRAPGGNGQQVAEDGASGSGGGQPQNQSAESSASKRSLSAETRTLTMTSHWPKIR